MCRSLAPPPGERVERALGSQQVQHHRWRCLCLSGHVQGETVSNHSWWMTGVTVNDWTEEKGPWDWKSPQFDEVREASVTRNDFWAPLQLGNLAELSVRMKMVLFDCFRLFFFVFFSNELIPKTRVWQRQCSTVKWVSICGQRLETSFRGGTCGKEPDANC